MYSAPKDARTGQPLYASFLPGSEGSEHTAKDARPGWSGYWANPRKPEEPQRVEFFRSWAFGDAKWDWWSFDWGKDIDLVRAKVSPMVDAASADLSAFHARGGKLILFMGWDDPVGAAMDIVGYRDRVARHDEFVRLYMVPGMWHCAEGAGATSPNSPGPSGSGGGGSSSPSRSGIRLQSSFGPNAAQLRGEPYVMKWWETGHRPVR